MSGFTPVGTTDGSDYHGKLQDFVLDGASLAFQQDMVTLGTSVADDERARVEAADATTEALVGAIDSFYPNFNDEGSLIRNYHPAGTTVVDDQTVKVAVGNQIVFVGVDGVGGIDGSDIGDTFSLTFGTGDVITGASAQLISNAALAAGDYGVTIVGLEQSVGNDYGVAGETKLLCVIDPVVGT